MISGELLEEVFGRNIEGFYFDKDICTKNNTVLTIATENEMFFINIHELAHKCKEWALSKSFSIVSHIRNDYKERKDEIKLCRAIIHRDSDFTQIGYEYLYGDTEPEAIFKACEWILERKAI